MNKIKIFIGILLVTFLSLNSYAQSWKSSNTLQGTDNITVIESKIDSEGSVYVYGFFVGTLQPSSGEELVSLGSRDYFLIKFLQNGDIQWTKQLGGPSFEYISGGIGIDSNDDIYITGGYRTYLKYSQTDSLLSTGGFDLFMAKYSKLGDVIWIRNTGEGSSNQRPTSIEVDKNDNLILSGFFTDSISLNGDTSLYSNDGFDDYFYSKFENSNGDLIWVKQIKAISSVNSGRLTSVAITNEAYVLNGFFADSIVIENDTIVAASNLYDVHLIKTDLSGNHEWVRTINGENYEYSYGVVTDQIGNIYCAGYYNSDTLSIQSNESEFINYNVNNGLYDFMMVKYSAAGDLLWFNANGGKGEDKLYDAKFFNDEFVVAGHFADTLNWGAIQLTTNDVNDVDMFVGNIDTTGNYRSSNNFAGRSNSWEEARAVFNDSDNLYTVIRSDADILELGDSIYTSANDKFYVALGIIGCLPISVDNVVVTDVGTCYGDSTGSLLILATGGFGAPWVYSIDNGLSSTDLSFFGDLPAGDYPVVVVDKEGCAQPGNIEVVNQPDTLSLELISSSDITLAADGSIVVAASGGSSPYTYTLQPDGIIQGFGTYTFGLGDSGIYYVEVNDIQGCGPVATDSITIEDNSTDNVRNLSVLQLKVFPNPSSGILTIEMPYDEQEAKLEILSLSGQVILSRQVYSLGGVINETIDVSDFSKGMYMLRIDGKTLRSGIVVN